MIQLENFHLLLNAQHKYHFSLLSLIVLGRHIHSFTSVLSICCISTPRSSGMYHTVFPIKCSTKAEAMYPWHLTNSLPQSRDSNKYQIDAIYKIPFYVLGELLCFQDSIQYKKVMCFFKCIKNPLCGSGLVAHPYKHSTLDS